MKSAKRCGCILWTGATYPNGYGKIYRELPKRNGKRRRVTKLAHRDAYEAHYGTVGDNLVIHTRHCSGDKRCVNPDHLTKRPAPLRMREWMAREIALGRMTIKAR